MNGKVYIGLTTTTLEYRWQRHKTEGRNINNTKPLYRAMRKYGIDNFTVEQIDSADTLEELGELERYYIHFYDSQNPDKGYNLTAGGEAHQWDGNSAAKVTYDDVVNIRYMYAMGDLSVTDCWKMYYQDKISFSGFQKIWDGVTWKHILDEVYTPEALQRQNQFKVHNGEKNVNAQRSNEEVLEARQYYINHTLQQTYDQYGQGYSKDGFREMLTRCYSNIPIYRKNKKCWTLNGQIIDIDNYKPVSTILESEE